MKLFRVGPHGHERPAAQLEDGVTVDIYSLLSDITPSTLSREPLDLRRRVAIRTLVVSRSATK